MKNKVRFVINYGFFSIQILTLILLLIGNKPLEFVYGVISTTVGYGLYLYLEQKFNLFTSNYILGGLVVTLISHHFIGEYLGFYQTSFIFDKVLHVFGTYVLTNFTYGLLIQILNISFTSLLSQGIFVILLGVSIGAGFEILEFVMDLVVNPEIPYQDSLVDTDMDIISDIVGAFIASLHIRIITLRSYQARI